MAFTMKNILAVRDNVFLTLGAVALRQLLLIAAGLLLPHARAHGLLELVALGLLVAIVLGWGQWRSWQAAKMAIGKGDGA
jgi:hypothetical protein